ncbi:hypothetical protein [Bradyrhizobium ganzhouense]|uniref:hypothetical protein n=1 Tax=Bradyrhizobium ganzhouense TaxID=1179767 RepID=UPI003CEC64E2
MLKHLLGIIFLMTQAVPSASCAEEPKSEIYEINTQLMETTFQVLGPSAKVKGETVGGTVFFMGKPTGDGKASFVLITAAHVLDDIDGDLATLMFRWKNAAGAYERQPYQFSIREQGKPLYVTHPTVDVAALYMRMPTVFANIRMLDIALIGTDEWLKQFEIHPGDELLCLGYPLFIEGPNGYPILRSGKIASYPLVPSKEQKNWLFDFRVFPGNSGGPVYFVDRNRTYGGQTKIGETIQFLAGLVTAQINSNIFKDKDLGLGVVIPAAFIRETLDLLPAKSPYP